MLKLEKSTIKKVSLFAGLLIVGYFTFTLCCNGGNDEVKEMEVAPVMEMEMAEPSLGAVHIQIGNGEEDRHVVILQGSATSIEAGTTVFNIEGHDKIKTGMLQLYDAPVDGVYGSFKLSLDGDVNGQEFFGSTSDGADVFFQDDMIDIGAGLIITDNTIVPYFSQSDTTDVSIDAPFKLPVSMVVSSSMVSETLQ